MAVFNDMAIKYNQTPITNLPEDFLIYATKRKNDKSREDFYLIRSDGRQWRSYKSLKLHLDHKYNPIGDKCPCESCGLIE